MVEPTPAAGFDSCQWPLDPACLTDEWGTFDVIVQERSRMLAGATLRRLTGYRVGGCPVTVRPCKVGCSKGLLPLYRSGASFSPHINEMGFWINSCGCLTDCSCGTLCEIELPGPVGAVYAVKVDGATVAASNYRVDGTRLVWTGAGVCPWPTCQDLSKPDTEVGTFSVRYLNAYEVDGLGEYAAGVLAMEFARACVGDPCRLPSNITNLSRQGVSMEIEPGAFPNGITGIREVDAYIAIYNPDGLRQQTRVWSPDLRTPRVMR